MIIKIDTSSNNDIEISFYKGDKVILARTIVAKYKQSERLLPFLSELLQEQGVKKEEIEKIIVNDVGEGFSSLRIGVVSANALAYALKVPIEAPNNKSEKIGHLNIIKPKYSKEPNIG